MIGTHSVPVCVGSTGVYTNTFNRRPDRVGHLRQGRYKAVLVDKDSYLLELSRYLVLNPLRAGLCASAEG